MELNKSRDYNQELLKIEKILSEFEKNYKRTIQKESTLNFQNYQDVRGFQEAYNFVMVRYKLTHSIKPCVAYVLVNEMLDGWQRAKEIVVFEALRVVDGDVEKAKELLKPFYEINKNIKKSRTWADIEAQIRYEKRKRTSKKSCEYISGTLLCVGCKSLCYQIRGICSKKINEEKIREANKVIRENQVNLLLKRVLDEGLNLKLSKKALDLYLYLVKLYELTGYRTLFLSYKRITKEVGIKQSRVKKYLDELKEYQLITYDIPKKREKIDRNGVKYLKVSEITLLGLIKEPKNQFQEYFYS